MSDTNREGRPPRRLRFGVFELDTDEEALYHRGREVSVQEMPLKVLAVLLERPGELVRREELFQRLWPNDRLGILDDNLNVAISKLRQALHDTADHPRYVATVPRKGYRFVAPVTELPTPPERSASTESDVPSPTQHATDGPRRAPAPAWFRRPASALAAVALAAGAAALLAFYITGAGDAPPAAQDSATPTIAVLPFANLSGDPGQAYFSDGLTEEILDRLASSKGLRVVSRTSSFAFKNRDMDAREIGRLLGATALVEGSVRREGDRLRISAQLVDAASGYQLWSESFDRRMDDVFAIQQQIALAIAQTLKGRLLAPEEAEALEPEAIDPEAYDHFLRGRHHWHRRTEAGLRQSATHFEWALDRAPDYVPAWVGLADAYAVLGFYDYLPPREAFPRARDAAERALDLDLDNASAWATLGYVALYYDWDLQAGEAAFRRAIERDPTDSKSHQWYANLLTAAGRFQEAEREMRRATELDPLSLIANAALGWVRYYAGRHEAALEQLRLTRELDPDFELAYLWSGWSLEALERYGEAQAMLEEAVKRSGGTGISTASLARVHALRGDQEKAHSLLAELEADETYQPAYEIGKAWLAIGERDKTMDWLERALEQRSHSMVFIHVDPQLDALRNDPRFQALAERVRPEP